MHHCHFAPILSAADLAGRGDQATVIGKATVVDSKHVSVGVNLGLGTNRLLP